LEFRELQEEFTKRVTNKVYYLNTEGKVLEIKGISGKV
jgi:hypothetical protein